MTLVCKSREAVLVVRLGASGGDIWTKKKGQARLAGGTP